MRSLLPLVLFVALGACATPQGSTRAYLVRDVACKGVRILYGLCEASEQVAPAPESPDGGTP